MASHLLGASVQLHDLIRLRSECALWRQRARSAAASGGAQRTARRGRGLEIEEIRAYQATDDARDIDWRVTARKGRAHTKVYREEREQPLLFGLDLRLPMAFGSRDRFKSVAVAELFALQAWAALADENRVGAVLASAEGVHSVAPQRGEAAILQLLARVARTTVRAATAVTAAATASDERAAPSLDTLLSALLQRSRAGHRCVVMSDFHDLTTSAVQRLQHIARQGETECVLVFDPLEADLPPAGQYTLLAADGHTRLQLDSADAGVRARHAERMLHRRGQLASLARLARIRVTELCVDVRASTLAGQPSSPGPQRHEIVGASSAHARE